MTPSGTARRTGSSRQLTLVLAVTEKNEAAYMMAAMLSANFAKVGGKLQTMHLNASTGRSGSIIGRIAGNLTCCSKAPTSPTCLTLRTPIG